MRGRCAPWWWWWWCGVVCVVRYLLASELNFADFQNSMLTLFEVRGAVCGVRRCAVCAVRRCEQFMLTVVRGVCVVVLRRGVSSRTLACQHASTAAASVECGRMQDRCNAAVTTEAARSHPLSLRAHPSTCQSCFFATASVDWLRRCCATTRT